jgi:nucleotide-binding universal stress UspA family protein
MKRILIPTDFSDSSLASFKFALDLAKEANARLFVVHMIELPILPETTFGIQPRPIDPKQLKELENRATAAFQQMKSKYPTKVTVSFHAINNHVVDGIRTFIQEKKIDLIVMSNHGASGLNEFFFGSTAEKISRLSPVPVISIPKQISFKAIKDIVFPTALEVDLKPLIRDLKELQQLLKAKLHVLFVNTPVHFYSDSQAAEGLEKFANYYKLHNYSLNFRSNHLERNGILEFMNEIKGDMIAMPTHGRTGLARFLKGSITESVLNTIDHPIWTWKLKK